MNFLYSILATIIEALYKVTGNFGLAIIGVTIITKIVTLPLTLKQDKSMKAMKEIQPEIDKIKEKYSNDSKLMNQKIMELYQERKINPAGGCLPLIIQMPILFALFGVLRMNQEVLATLGTEVNGVLVNVVYPYTHLPTIPSSETFLWLALGNPDPFFILPILNGILSFVQQKLTGNSENPQMKQMMYMFPIMMVFISYKMPAGLQVYWVTSTLIGIVQQYWIVKKGSKKEDKKEKIS